MARVDSTPNEQATGRSVGSGVGGGAAADKAKSSDFDDEITSLTQEAPEDERTVAAAASSITDKRKPVLRDKVGAAAS